MFNGRIITVGISPAWDIKCTCQSLKWNQHVNIDKKTSTPAGKALNVSKALAWNKITSTAAGLWGTRDHKQMTERMKQFSDLIKIKTTPVPGQTRQNFWILDKEKNRDIHLRDKNDFLTKSNIRKLFSDLNKLVKKNDTLVFAGSMPEFAVDMIKNINSDDINLVIDTSGPALKKIKTLKNVFAIKPNIEELKQLLGCEIKNSPTQLIKHSRRLLKTIENIIITRSKAGAILVNKTGCWQAEILKNNFKTLGTVGCGDYFLAGFIAGMKKYENYEKALQNAIISGSARAYGMDKQAFSTAKSKLKTRIKNYTS